MPSTKKLLTITGWLLGSLSALYLLLLFAASIYINTQQQRILQYITTGLRKHIRGTITIGAVNVSPWTSFPSVDFRMQDIVISDSIHHLPVLTLQKASTSFSLLRLITKKIVISNVQLENGSLHLETDSTGYSNSFFIAGTQTSQQEPGTAAVSIGQVSLKNISLVVADKVKEKEISFVVHSLRARITGENNLQHILMTENISMKKGLGFNLARGAFLENQSINGKWNLQYNPSTKTISFDKAQVEIGKHPFLLKGQFSFQPGNPLFTIGFTTEKISYLLAKEIVTATIRKKLAIVDVRKPLDADGTIEGSLLPAREPAVNINWHTNNNELVTEAGTFSQCSFDGNFNNSVDPGASHVDSNSAITFRGLRAKWDGIAFTADSCSITNLDTARLRLHVLSQCSLADLDNKLGMQDIAFKSGNAGFDVWYDGPIVRDKSMLQGIRGTITIKDGTVDYIPRGFSFTRCNGSLALFKDSIGMDNFSCRYNGNQFDVALYGSNVRRTLIAGDSSQISVMDCFVSAPFIDMNDFTSLFGQPKKRGPLKQSKGSFAASARSIDLMLDNSSIAVHVKATTFKRDNLHGESLDAVVNFEPGRWALEKISMKLAGGTIACNGSVLLAANNIHQAVFNIKVANADVSKLMFAFDNFGQDAITSHELSGRLSTVASLKADISSLGHIMPASLKGEVDFSLQQGSLLKYEPLNRLKSFVFKNRDLSNVHFAELKDKLAIDGETIVIPRMEIQSSAFRLFIEGIYGLSKKNTDLLIQVPFSNLNSNSFSSGNDPVNKGLVAKTGASIWLRAVNDEDGKVKIKLTMKKSVKPGNVSSRTR